MSAAKTKTVKPLEQDTYVIFDPSKKEEPAAYQFLIKVDDKVKFSPSKGATTILKMFDIVPIETPGGNINLWIYNEDKGIYVKDNGYHTIFSIIDKALANEYGDKFNRHMHSELLVKITDRTPHMEMSDFDTDPELLCVKNGIINLRTGEFLKHDQKHKMTIQIPVNYDPEAKCPEFDKFLNDVLESKDDTEFIYDLITSLCIKTSFDIIAQFIGMGSNGKGVLLKHISAFVGADNITSIPISSLSKAFDRYEIYRKLVIINSEVEGTAKTFDIMKAIASGELMDAEVKYGPHVEFKPFCPIIFDTNNPMAIGDNSYGKIRRHYALNFVYQFKDNPNPLETREKQRDPYMLEKITTESELSGLLNIVIERAPRLLKNKALKKSKDLKKLAEDYDKQSHSISSFVDDCCIITNEEKDFISIAELEDAYKRYCIQINTSPLNIRSLSTYLKNECNLIKCRNGAARTRGYKGIQLVFPIVTTDPEQSSFKP